VEGQNVGIGTPTPFGKLSINTESTNWNFPSLLLTQVSVQIMAFFLIVVRASESKIHY
jgi:hypothetical protein